MTDKYDPAQLLVPSSEGNVAQFAPPKLFPLTITVVDTPITLYLDGHVECDPHALRAALAKCNAGGIGDAFAAIAWLALYKMENDGK